MSAQAPTEPEPSSATSSVTAVLVAHDGARWLPEALAALAAQSVPPTRVVAVDTGSADGSTALLRAALGDDAVVVLPRTTGYPDAVAAGVAHAAAGADGPPAFLWLLHDDAAPDPGCLQALLEEAARQPSAAVLGPKAVDWDDPKVLVEVGVTTDRGGTRTTGLERRERDQGQHDAVRDVLAVGTAGLLVRREAWEAVGGLDPVLPLFRDELDLGWRVRSTGARVVVVPSARLRHARAATTGRRAPGAVRGRAPRVDRRHALFVLLAHASRRRLLLSSPGLVLGSLARALGLLLLRRVREARDEAAALGGVLRRPGRLRAARRRRRALRTVPPSHVRPLLASRAARVRGRAESLAGWLAGGGAPARSSPAALRDPGGEGADDVLPVAPGLARSLLGHPSVLVVVGLALVALLAERDLLPLGGLLAGGRLLPPPAGASDLWAAYTSSWAPAGVGTPAPSPPRVGVLAGLSTLLLGKPWLAVDVLLLAAVPLSGLTAYLAARRVVTSAALRVWAAVTWALLPVATGAVAAGRLDAAFVQVVLPLLLTALAATVRHDPRGRWHRVPAAGLLLAVTTALAPTLWLVAAPLLVLVGLAGLAGASRAQRSAAGRRAVAALAVAVLPVVLLVPWPLEAARSPALLLHGPGAVALDPALVEPGLPAWRLLLLDPGGAATPPSLVTAGLLLAALAALLPGDRRRPALAGWGLALAGLALAVGLARTAVAPATGGPEVPVWPGLALQVAAAGLLLAALVAGDGARTRLARRDFGWRQVAATVTAAAAALVPLTAGAAWVARAADGPLERGVEDVVPAFVEAELEDEPGVRALVLDARSDGTVGYELWSAPGVRLGTADLPLEQAQADALDDVVADLLSARGSGAAEALSTRAVRYVVLPAAAGSGEAGSAVVAALDSQPGVVRRADDPALLWQLQAPAAHLSVLPPEIAREALAGTAGGPDPDTVEAAPPRALPSGRQESAARVPAGEPDRLLVLAEAADDGWRATLDGERLEPVRAWGWAQAFSLPADGGRLQLGHEDDARTAALWAQGVAVLVTAVLAVPGGRRRSGLEPVDAVEPPLPRGGRS